MNDDTEELEARPRTRHAALQTRAVLGNRSASNSPCGQATQHSFVCPTAVNLTPAVPAFGQAVSSSTTSAQSAQALANVWHEPPAFTDTQETDMADTGEPFARISGARAGTWDEAAGGGRSWAAPWRFDAHPNHAATARAAPSTERASVRPTSAPGGQSGWQGHGSDVQAPSARQALEAQLARNFVAPGAAAAHVQPHTRAASMFGAASVAPAKVRAATAACAYCLRPPHALRRYSG